MKITLSEEDIKKAVVEWLRTRDVKTTPEELKLRYIDAGEFDARETVGVEIDIEMSPEMFSGTRR